MGALNTLPCDTVLLKFEQRLAVLDMQAAGRSNSDTVRSGADKGCRIGCTGCIVIVGAACETPINGSLKKICCPKHVLCCLQVGVLHGDGSVKSGMAAFGVLVRSNTGQGGAWGWPAAMSKLLCSGDSYELIDA
eukprot:CAMPEP_0169247858 /NCGR_PEP_ID=MMETSP1016-20121227/35520_1 /TAXON_ID=342587 /ORGANISM="Karlodinium micrum, Strain CCMP2283" /LENGTH=133 /DNA_ID=CAMNT_0009328589 /DNA_START=388 /DNA_END=789 /DNA_ORIENTATION=+